MNRSNGNTSPAGIFVRVPSRKSQHQAAGIVEALKAAAAFARR